MKIIPLKPNETVVAHYGGGGAEEAEAMARVFLTFAEGIPLQMLWYCGLSRLLWQDVRNCNDIRSGFKFRLKKGCSPK